MFFKISRCGHLQQKCRIKSHSAVKSRLSERTCKSDLKLDLKLTRSYVQARSNSSSSSSARRLVDSVQIMGVLAHELDHATVGTSVGHRGPFKQCALKIGLRGPMRATTPTPEFTAWAEALFGRIGTKRAASRRGRCGGRSQASWSWGNKFRCRVH